MTLVKVCGITSLADALAAVDAGADALGFNFYRPSPRYIAPPDARKIIDQLPESVLKVGVFVNEGIHSVVRIAEEAGLSAVQLHGDESPEYCRELAGTSACVGGDAACAAAVNVSLCGAEGGVDCANAIP